MLRRTTRAPCGLATAVRPRQQAGMATLMVAMLAIALVSLALFHSHLGIWLEQRSVANQARAKQAHAAAEAGLEVTLGVLNADSGTPSRTTHLSASATAGKFNISSPTRTGSAGPDAPYSVVISLVGGDSAPVDRFLLSSTGGSDCTSTLLSACSAQAAVSQIVKLTPILLNPPTTNISVNNSPGFFASLFGAPQATIKSLTTPITTEPLNASSSGLVWQQGSRTLNGNVGSVGSPVLLVVEGNLTLPAGAMVYGFVYVTGNVTCVSCGAPSIQGAVAVAGTSNLAATNVTLDTNVLDRLKTTAPRFAKAIGTWRDW